MTIILKQTHIKNRQSNCEQIQTPALSITTTQRSNEQSPTPALSRSVWQQAGLIAIGAGAGVCLPFCSFICVCVCHSFRFHSINKLCHSFRFHSINKFHSLSPHVLRRSEPPGSLNGGCKLGLGLVVLLFRVWGLWFCCLGFGACSFVV